MAKVSGGFVYRGNLRTPEDVARRAKHSSGLYDSAILDGFTVFKPKEGENIIRILPFTWQDVDKWGASWEIIVAVHNNIGPDRGTFICLDKMQDESCPVCEARRSAVDDEERYALAPNERALCWLIDRNDEKAGPQWWLMPIKKVFKVINARSTDKKSGALLLVDDPEEGYDIYFTREGTGKTTDYTGVEIDRDPTPPSENAATQAKWLAYVQEHPLPDILNFQDHDYIEKVLMGRVSKKAEAEAEEDEAAEPAPRTRRRPGVEDSGDPTDADPPPRTARRRPVEAQEEGSEAEGEEATPAPTRARRRPEPEPEAEEAEPELEASPIGRRRPVAEEPEEEPEADPPPRTTRRRAPAAEPEEEEIPPESAAARRSLEKLRPGARR
jgi:hypothetical protein